MRGPGPPLGHSLRVTPGHGSSPAHCAGHLCQVPLAQGQPAPSAGGKQHQVRWTTALQGQCCHGSTTVLPAMGHCHPSTSHGALPPHCQPWGTATLPPAVGHCHPTANQAGSVHGAAHSNTTNRSRGQVEQGDKVTEGAQQGTNSLTKSGWDIPELHMPWSHQGAWTGAAPCDPSWRETPREKKCCFVPSASRATPCPPTQPP